MYKDLDKEIKKVFLKKVDRLIIVLFLCIYFILWFLIPKNFLGIILWLLIPGIICFTLIVLIYKKEKSDIEKAKIICNILTKHRVNSPKKLILLIDSNRSRVQKVSFIQIATFLLSITAIFISIIDNAEQYLGIIFVLIIEILAISLVYVVYYDIFSDQEYIKELDRILNYLYINYEIYFNKKETLIQRVVDFIQHLI